MSVCKKCGQELKEGCKFCGSCGEPVEQSVEPVEQGNVEYDGNKLDTKKPKNIFKFIIIFVIVVLLGAAAFLFFSINAQLNASKNVKNITILSIDTEKFPSVQVKVNTININDSINDNSFAIKEEESFPQNISVEKAPEDNTYIITYKSLDEKSTGDRNVKVSYLDNGKDISAEETYKAPEVSKKSVKSGSITGDNSVNTYDGNIEQVASDYNSFINALIEAVNSKNPYYLSSYVDQSGGEMKDFETTINSYKDQNIDEDLIESKVEQTTKINDSQYSVVATEKYRIFYGKTNETKTVDFRTTYTFNKIGSNFKLLKIEKIDKLNSY